MAAPFFCASGCSPISVIVIGFLADDWFRRLLFLHRSLSSGHLSRPFCHQCIQPIRHFRVLHQAGENGITHGAAGGLRYRGKW